MHLNGCQFWGQHFLKMLTLFAVTIFNTHIGSFNTTVTTTIKEQKGSTTLKPSCSRFYNRFLPRPPAPVNSQSGCRLYNFTFPRLSDKWIRDSFKRMEGPGCHGNLQQEVPLNQRKEFRNQEKECTQRFIFWWWWGVVVRSVPSPAAHAMLCRFRRVRLSATLWTVAHQAPLCMGFSRQEYWRRFPRPSPGDLPGPRVEPASLASPARPGRFFTASATWEALRSGIPNPPLYLG